MAPGDRAGAIGDNGVQVRTIGANSAGKGEKFQRTGKGRRRAGGGIAKHGGREAADAGQQDPAFIALFRLGLEGQPQILARMLAKYVGFCKDAGVHERVGHHQKLGPTAAVVNGTTGRKSRAADAARG